MAHNAFVGVGLESAAVADFVSSTWTRIMKAIVVHQYGGPEVLKYEDYPDPVPGTGEVLVRVAAASVNPIDYKRRAGLTQAFYPMTFPGLIGVDVSGTVAKLGPGAEGFSVGDQVFAMADNAYAELCVVKADALAKVPVGLDLVGAAALPLVTVTGNQLMFATEIKASQTVLVAGAAGNVGRSAVFTAKDRGATVIAGVLKRQIDDVKTVGADQVVATDDDAAIASLSPLDAVADTVGGKTAEKLIGKVKPGGVYASVVEAPQSAAYYPSVKMVHVFSHFDRRTLEFMAAAVRDGKLVIPIGPRFPLSRAAEAHTTAEKGGVGKILLVP
jgi:NADPH:quinone reductase-like Zn-dependent oxidoreductase